MLRYTVKRILLIIPIMIGVSFIVFSIMNLTPGDPARNMLGVNAPQSAVDSLRTKLGLDEPFLVRYFNYVKDACMGDFGTSYRTGIPVFREIQARLPVTAKLAFFSILVVCALGLFLGVVSAVKQYSVLDTLCSVSAVFVACIPNFWLGLILILIFSLSLGWLPPYGIENWKGYILPIVVLSLPSAAELLRLTRSTMLDTIHQDYIRTARAKGAPRWLVIEKHALKNALLPVITVIGSTFGALLGGTVITETVFALPGLGSLIVSSIRSKDIPQVMAATMVTSLLSSVALLIVDILYAWVDPRIRVRYEK